MASYLESPGRKRKQKFQRVLQLYDARSKAAHGSAKHDSSTLYDTYDLLRRVVIKMIEERAVPSKAELESELFGSDAVGSLTENDRVAHDFLLKRSQEQFPLDFSDRALRRRCLF